MHTHKTLCRQTGCKQLLHTLIHMITDKKPYKDDQALIMSYICRDEIIIILAVNNSLCQLSMNELSI
jgi:hypothetical protein